MHLYNCSNLYSYNKFYLALTANIIKKEISLMKLRIFTHVILIYSVLKDKLIQMHFIHLSIFMQLVYVYMSIGS